MKKIFLTLITILIAISCSKDNPVNQSSVKEITKFGFKELSSFEGRIDHESYTIDVAVPHDADITNLTAVFSVTGVSVKVGDIVQRNGRTANDFRNPIIYTVVAQDGTTQDYTVTATPTLILSSEKEFTAFSFSELSPIAQGKINQDTRTIVVGVPAETTDVSVLKASFVISEKASVGVNGEIQVSDITPNDFRSPVTYTVTAEDGTTKEYTVTVIKYAPIPDNNFRNYLRGKMPNAFGIDENIDKLNINAPEVLDMENISVDGIGIGSLTGIEYFVNLKHLSCTDNSSLTSLNVSKNILLEELYFGDCQVETLDISNNIHLKYLRCGYNRLNNLDLSKNIDLILLDCTSNGLETLDISAQTNWADAPGLGLYIHYGYGAENALTVLKVHDLQKNHPEVKTTKTRQGSGVTISTYANGVEDCHNYNPADGVERCLDAP